MLYEVITLTPRIDSYNFIYGYFPGFTYDEDLTITPTLLAWRSSWLQWGVRRRPQPRTIFRPSSRIV